MPTDFVIIMVSVVILGMLYSTSGADKLVKITLSIISTAVSAACLLLFFLLYIALPWIALGALIGVAVIVFRSITGL